MSKNPEREALIKEGIKLEVDFKDNISTPNLQKRVDAKKEELAAQMQENEETHDDEMIIKRISACGNYRPKIKGIKEAARRSDLTIEEVKEALENGKPVNGWKFEVVK